MALDLSFWVCSKCGIKPTEMPGPVISFSFGPPMLCGACAPPRKEEEVNDCPRCQGSGKVYASDLKGESLPAKIKEMIEDDIRDLREQAVRWAEFYKGMHATLKTAPPTPVADHLESLLKRIQTHFK